MTYAPRYTETAGKEREACADTWVFDAGKNAWSRLPTTGGPPRVRLRPAILALCMPPFRCTAMQICTGKRSALIILMAFLDYSKLFMALLCRRCGWRRRRCASAGSCT